MTGRLPLQVFANVPVVPVTRVHQHVALGGPVWPDFAAQTVVRHCRAGQPVDEEPAVPARMDREDRPAVWGGFLDKAFGHFVAEHLPRLPFALEERPRDLYLFTVDPGVTRDTLSPWVWQMFDWIGLAPDQVCIVQVPLVVTTLRAGGQSEMLPKVAPCGDYLDAVAKWATNLVPERAPILYVTREGMSAGGRGVHAGESHLTGLLRARGVAVMNPAVAPLRQQLAAYAGAGHILFAEGSALHGRQLLGRLRQDITVLRRRPGRNIANSALTPRCDVLHYHDVTGHALMTYWRNGQRRPDPALRFYDVPKLLAALRATGLDLAVGWDEAAYVSAAVADVRAWIAWHRPATDRMAEYRRTLARIGLGGWDG